MSTAPTGAVPFLLAHAMKIVVSEKNKIEIFHNFEKNTENQEKSLGIKIARISEKGVILRNPLESTKALFFHFTAEGIDVSNNIGELLSSSNSEIDYSFALKNIVGEECYEHDTLWKSIKCLPPGAALRVDVHSGSLKFEILDQIDEQLRSLVPTCDPMKILAKEIGQCAETGCASSINVNFSGGCDSLGLLMAARSIGHYPLSAVTWTYDEGSAHEDLIAAQKFTSALGVRHLVLDIDPNHIFAPITRNELTPSVSTSVAFHHFRKILNAYVLEELGPNTLMVNGHGGDHLYMDPMPIEVVFDVYHQFGFKSAASTLGNLASLHGENFLRLLNKHRRQPLHRSTQIKFFFNQQQLEKYTWKEEKQERKSAKQIHRQRIRQAIYQNSTLSTDQQLLLATPFTCPKMIASVWNLHPKDFFDGRRNRIPFRNSMPNLAESHLFRKSSKGHITGAFQQALKVNKKYIIDAIQNGVLSAKSIINTPNVLQQIDMSTLGYGGLNPILLKIICFELTMRAK